MDSSKLASGDNNITQPLSPRCVEDISESPGDRVDPSKYEIEQVGLIVENEKEEHKDLTPQMINDNETKLKERIAECRNIIESLKIELNEEKAKLDKQNKIPQNQSECVSQCTTSYISIPNAVVHESDYGSNMYSDSVDSKLICDEGLIEYEKQLQKYQNTLNMAQMEKKNAIRKHMLAKAYRLKLLEVENQCNIELLRVKQSLQCLEPLHLIANKWKTTPAEVKYDYLDLNPRYPELSSNISSDGNPYELDFNVSPEKIESAVKEDTISLG